MKKNRATTEIVSHCSIAALYPGQLVAQLGIEVHPLAFHVRES